MAKAFVGIGLPRSGKTVHLQKLTANENGVYIGANEIRREIMSTNDTRSVSERVWKELYQRVSAALASGKNTVIDASNVHQEDRRKMAAHCRQAADEVIGYWIDTPLEVCLRRNKHMSENIIPDFVICNMADELKWNPPRHRDGFDQLIIVSA